MSRKQVLKEARAWLGTPYKHGADILNVGVDCLMLLVRVYAASRVIPKNFDPRPYPSDWHLHQCEERYLGGLLEFCDEVQTPKPADVAIWQFGRAFSHAAIVMTPPAKGGEIIHAYRPAKSVTLGHMTENLLADRPVKFFSMKKFATARK